jgi:hypothetical protein
MGVDDIVDIDADGDNYIDSKEGTSASVGGPAGMCGNDPIHNSSDVAYEDVTQDECSAKCGGTCYSFCSGQKGCGMWGCWACPAGSSNQNNTSNQSECSTNSDCGSGMECTNSRCYIDMGQMTHSECTDAKTEDSCGTLGSRCQWTFAETCVDAGL